jgi:nicotinate phosphoribosyltransferase
LGGFTGTSNVEAAQKLQIKCIGTMSHAYVTSFSSLDDLKPFNMGGVEVKKRAIEIRKELGFKTHDGELAAFLNFSQAFPNNFTALIDSYSTLESGMLNVVVVGKALIEAGIMSIGVRLDSGDLCELSKKCREIWNKHVPEVRLTISASDDLFEERLIQIEKEKSEIDIYAIGTNIATCKKQPALGLVCKLVELNGVPKMKLSSTPEKATYPCVKRIYRVVTEDKKFFDVIAIESEELSLGDTIEIGTLKEHATSLVKVGSIRLLNDVVEMNPVSINDSRAYVERSRGELPGKIFELQDGEGYKTFMTKKYLGAFEKAFEKASQGSKPVEENHHK